MVLVALLAALIVDEFKVYPTYSIFPSFCQIKPADVLIRDKILYDLDMTRRNIIIFIIAIGLVLIFWSSALLQGYFQKASVFLQNYGDLHPFLSILVFIGLSTLSAMLFSFSSIWLVPIAAVLWSNPFTVLLLLASWLIGAVFSYLIGKY